MRRKQSVLLCAMRSSVIHSKGDWTTNIESGRCATRTSCCAPPGRGTGSIFTLKGLDCFGMGAFSINSTDVSIAFRREGSIRFAPVLISVYPFLPFVGARSGGMRRECEPVCCVRTFTRALYSQVSHRKNRLSDVTKSMPENVFLRHA
jgi:hypothetical protein